jgi:hypothetical protein
VQGDRPRVLHHSFQGQSADQAGRLLGEIFMVLEPRMAGAEVAFYAKLRPVLQFLFDILARCFWL